MTTTMKAKGRAAADKAMNDKATAQAPKPISPRAKATPESRAADLIKGLRQHAKKYDPANFGKTARVRQWDKAAEWTDEQVKAIIIEKKFTTKLALVKHFDKLLDAKFPRPTAKKAEKAKAEA